MKRHTRALRRTWLLPVAVLLIAGHVMILPYALSHMALSAAVVTGVTILIVVKHLGLLTMLLGPLCARFQRRSPH